MEKDQLDVSTLRAQSPASFLAPSFLPKVILHNFYGEGAGFSHSMGPQKDCHIKAWERWPRRCKQTSTLEFWESFS